MEELIRYFVPGSIVVLPLYIVIVLLFNIHLKSSGEIFGMLTAVSATIGYIIQSYHMHIHEISYNLQRPMIKYILQKYKKENADHKQPDERQAFTAWDFCYCTKLRQGLRLHQRRAWDFTHSSKAVAYSSFCGAIISLIGFAIYGLKTIHNPRIYVFLVVMFFLYIILCIFFDNKYSRILKIVLTPSEMLSVDKIWKDLEEEIKVAMELPII